MKTSRYFRLRAPGSLLHLRFKFVQRTVPNISDAMEPLEHEIRHELLHKMLCMIYTERDV